MTIIRYNKASLRAKETLDETGFEDLIDYPLERFASGLGATVIEKPLANCDGRIIFGKKNCLIEINNNIEFEPKKRFTLAHEIGHFVLHPNIEVHGDDENTTSWFNNKEKQARKGLVEYEANQFAAELLVPSWIFFERQKGKKFSPQLLRDLASYFKVSLTSIAFKYFEIGDHPICLFHSYKKIVSYWKRPEDYPHFVKNLTKLAPPEDSVAMEFFQNGKIYSTEHSKQQVWKSEWFEMRDWEDDRDYNFYEFCIIYPKGNSVLSVVWEE